MLCSGGSSALRFVACVVLAAIALAGAAARADAQSPGAWQTFLRAFTYKDLIADVDTVLCATGEGGLLVFDRASRTFSSITREPGGLASNSLTSMARDLSGNLWLGTLASGVSRLAPNGQWALVNAFDGLPSEEIRALEPDPLRDSLWIATRAGIALWNGNEIAGALPDGVNPSPFASDDITGVVVRADSQFIATTLGIYLRRPLPGGGAAVDSINTGLPSRVIEGLSSDGTTVLCLTSDLVFRFDFSTTQWIATGGLGQVFRLQDDGGTVYASSQVGIAEWNGTSWTVIDATLVSTGNTQLQFGVTSDEAGQVIAGNLNGVYELPVGGGAGAAVLSSPDQPAGNNMNNLLIEGGRVYVHTIDQGIARWDGAQWRNWFPRSSNCTVGCDTTFINPVFAFALLADKDGRKWSACWAGRMEIWNDHVDPPSFTRPTYNDALDPVRHTFAAGAALDLRGGHWFGMDTPDLGNPDIAPIGLDYYDSIGTFVRNFRPENQPTMRGNGKIKAIDVDFTGRIWIGHSGAGVQSFTYTPGDTVITFNNAQPVEDLDVSGIVASGDTVWVSTTNDLRWYQRATWAHNSQNSYPIPAGPSQIATNPLAVATDGSIWLGTLNGIRVYNRDGSTRADYTAANSPLASDEVRTIRVDPASGAVWIATAGGLNRFDPFFVLSAPPPLPRLELSVYPNPSFLTGIGVRLSVQGNTTTYQGWVFDITGRRVRRVGAVNGGLLWDGRDEAGRVVDPGVYFIELQGGGRTATARVVLLR